MGRGKAQHRDLTPEQRLAGIRSIIREMESDFPTSFEEQLLLLREVIVDIIRIVGPQSSGGGGRRKRKSSNDKS